MAAVSQDTEPPQGLNEWSLDHIPTQHVWKDAFWDQVFFVRDELARLFFNPSEIDDVKVVGTYKSNSVCLPVYSIVVPDLVEVRLRKDFYYWIVSVNAVHDIDAEFYSLFNPTALQLPANCVGMSMDWRFGRYASDKSRFTVSFTDDYRLYAFCVILAGSLGIVPEYSPTAD